ncbi:MAG: hypothetical protein Q9M48_06175 [Rhodobacterales bacterium]|nr:hypothetical protein [Rhodobacterales bacterium]
MQHILKIPAIAPKPVLALAATLVLASCASLSLYYKEGVPVNRMQSDEINCEVRALKDVPVQNEVEITPAVRVPPSETCDARGNCTVTPGYTIPAEIEVIDVNIGLRERVAKQCMLDQGYQRVTIPACSSSLSNSVPTAKTLTLPKLGSNSCVIRNRGGSWQILNPQ